MKTAIYSLITLLITSASALAGIEGLWGGKWDDQWPVFLKVEKGSNSGTYKIEYIWLEDTEDSQFSTKNLKTKKIGDYFTTGMLSFKLGENGGLLYGDFAKPRMANLVKMDSPLPSVSEAGKKLQESGWKAGVIPAEDARKQIQGE
jgi:hypothetical protein